MALKMVYKFTGEADNNLVKHEHIFLYFIKHEHICSVSRLALRNWECSLTLSDDKNYFFSGIPHLIGYFISVKV